jgi:RNA polymerase sigma-70 factor (ECF subfamily)
MIGNEATTDAELVARTLAGDREAFGDLYDRYARLVLAIVRREAPGRSAHDLTQECFLRAYRGLGGLQAPDRFGAWLVGVARRVALDHRRSSRRDRHRFVEAEALDARAGLDPASAQDAEELALLLRRVAELPERERLAIDAFYLQEQDAARTAELLRLSRSGTYALLARALTRLASAMGLDGPEENHP